MNSRKKRFVNPVKIEVTRRARMEMILGKSPAIFNGHQPPRADDPYDYMLNDHKLFSEKRELTILQKILARACGVPAVVVRA